MNEVLVVTTDNIGIINERLERLYKIFSLDEIEEPVKVGDDVICIHFPEEHETIEYSISDFLMYTEDVESIIKINSSTVRNSRIVQTIVDIDDYFLNYININNNSLEDSKFKLRLCSNPFLIGLVASKEKKYEEDYGITPCSRYLVVEIIYSDKSFVLDEQYETELIKRYLFYISTKYNRSISIGEMIDVDAFFLPDEFDDEIIEEESDELLNISNGSLLKYSSLMDMYTEALSVGDPEIKYLYFYKIIEHCSPIVSKLKAYDMLNKKLDLLTFKNRDYKYLDSIFELTREYDTSLRDSELVNTVLSECIDIVELYEYLPETIKRKLSKKHQYKNTSLSYSFDLTKLTSIKQGISQILYSTRNNIVHAKSNYELTGDECKYEEMGDLNIFISKVCFCLIAWNDRQPEMFRIK